MGSPELIAGTESRAPIMDMLSNNIHLCISIHVVICVQYSLDWDVVHTVILIGSWSNTCKKQATYVISDAPTLSMPTS